MKKKREGARPPDGPSERDPAAGEAAAEAEAAAAEATGAAAAAPAPPPDDAAQWRDKYLRALAELDNYRKRQERDREIARLYATEALLREVLPVVDDLETASRIDANPDAIREGIALALRHLVNALEAKGMRPIDALGQPFDPRFHEAMGFLPAAGKPPNTVVAELKRGYVFHDRVLRPAKVQIAMAPLPAEDEEGAGGPT
jgi:molecular chaperone GrpE